MANIRTELKRIDNILFEDAGTNGANDYMAQMSWILFLKYLDDLEDTRRTEAVFRGEPTDIVNDYLELQRELYAEIES